MGLFGPSREERARAQQSREKQIATTEAYAGFRRLIDRLRPRWVLGVGAALEAECRLGEETIELEISWPSGSITEEPRRWSRRTAVAFAPTVFPRSVVSLLRAALLNAKPLASMRASS